MERPTELKTKQAWNGLYPVAYEAAATAADYIQSLIFNLF